ncbi:kinase-like domain-containing protein [Choanephora cucurbitarum]|nr:kinase-like domain-containing protein [Choanephora cucurbitarum]
MHHLQLIDIIGKGAYGQVYLARSEQENALYAIKSVNTKLEKNEVELHQRLSHHPNIISLKKVIRQPNNITQLVLEYGPEGDLFSAITERDLYAGNHPLIKKVFLQLIDAVMYAHEHHVYHRDLKPENILVFEGGQTIKLADFGLATSDTVSREYGCGSTFYYSPECQGDLFQNNRHQIGYATAPNDVWALGVILVNLATGRNPWQQASLRDETFRKYLANPADFLLSILPISRELNSILKRIFCVDPIHRITLEQLRKKIENCRYFTRTAEVDQYEYIRTQQKIMALKRRYQQKQEKMKQSAFELPPSPPATPCSDRSLSKEQDNLSQMLTSTCSIV